VHAGLACHCSPYWEAGREDPHDLGLQPTDVHH
jgi:hypothetical protein